MSARSTFFACFAAVAVLAASSIQAAGKPAITKPKFDPNAPVVGLFEAMKDKQLEVKLIQKNSKSGNLLIENKTQETLTVALPDAFAGVHVLNQFGGGGLGGGGGGLGGGQQGGGGFFSIPPEKLVRLPVNSVCLEHGKPEPSSRMEYRVVPVEKVSTDPVLRQLLRFVATGRVNKNVAQAAAWHIANGKSWRELAAMKHQRAGSLPSPPIFSQAELRYADMLVATAKVKAKENADKGQARPAQENAPRRGQRGNR